ncbi:anoctamin-7-like [Oppia nitens]|uniref:anoctamin-7-like n=1 Tax=Oppia nitens TaxID=1686743 RepID=UPI0023D9A4B3|nr:anoctamin-7-like [Oppia nitens]
MPLGRYVEKYELNGKGSGSGGTGGTGIAGTGSYGSIASCVTQESQVMLDPKNKNFDDDSSDSDTVAGTDNNNTIDDNNGGDDNCITFNDKKRQIDYILVYEESSESLAGKSEKYRKKFLKNLRQLGIEIEESVVKGSAATVQYQQQQHTGARHRQQYEDLTDSTSNRYIHFVKLYVPFPVMCTYAEHLCLRAPLQALPNNPVDSYGGGGSDNNWSDHVFHWLRLPNPMYDYVPNRPLAYYTCPFKMSKLGKFVGSDDPHLYFQTQQRIRVIHDILESTLFGKRSLAQLGISRLVEQSVFQAAYPLHDGQYDCPRQVSEPQHLNKRQILYHYWAQWSKWYKYQPLDHIRDYFGEKITIYFAWLGFYTSWLIPASIVGVLVFLYGLFSINSDIPSQEICQSGQQYRMCPTCDEHQGCQYWSLSETCLYSRLSVMFDHSGTVLYAVFISFWSVAFLEYWKRKSVSLAHHWGSIDCNEEERPRPQFSARAPHIERNPITGTKEPTFPKNVRYLRITAGYMTIVLMLVLVFIFMIAVIIYRIILVSMQSYQSPGMRNISSLISSSTGAVVNLILIMSVGMVYEKLAYRLTEWEMHRTQSEFDNQLAFKVFIFQFVNFYASIFYIAFFKGRFVGRPGQYGTIFGLRNEECSTSGCLMELTQQLAIIMIGKQVINNARELLVPMIQSWYHRQRTGIEHRDHRQYTRWERDYRLIGYDGLFEEYLEMILQFGFITIFVAAFPLAPLFALINNWFEIRLDAHKLVCHTRRPIPERANNIGVWFPILTFLAHFAVISNAFLIAFTSDFIPKTLYLYEMYGSDSSTSTASPSSTSTASLSGFVNFTLATAPAGTMNQTCRYRDFRDPNGEHTVFYWKLQFLRFVFVVVFEHLVFSICRLIDLVVPDIPGDVERKIKRERYLARQALTDSALGSTTVVDNDDDDAGDDAGNATTKVDDAVFINVNTNTTTTNTTSDSQLVNIDCTGK